MSRRAMDAFAFLDSLDQQRMDLTLGWIRAACAETGHPERAVPSVHVAGTNGKGSTCAFLESILRRAGYRVGFGSSPHLGDVRERIQVDREPIAERDFSRLVATHRSLIVRHRLTYFETVAFLGFLHFRDAAVDVAIWETGLGGRLDATNVVSPLVSVITSISLDHMKWLGSTLTEIAAEKCGIIKEEIPVVTSTQQPPEVLAVIRETAQQKKSLLYVSPPLKGGDRGKGHALGLLGAHQRENAALAVKAAELLAEAGWRNGDVPRALAATRWPGRLEVVRRHPLVVLDGAHNIGGATALANSLRSEFAGRPITLIFGGMADKELKGMIRILDGVAARWIFTRGMNERFDDPRRLKTLVPTNKAENAPDLAAALALALAEKKGQVIVIAGSLYLVGEAKSLL